MRKKIIVLLFSIIILISLASVTFAWFYFPNSKGLEIDTAPALDFNIDVYKIIDNVDENGNYSSSNLINLTEAKDENNVNYYNPTLGTLTINEAFEFFQWGDEFICEDTDALYYALDVTYESNSFSDGYIKNILSATLESTGSFECTIDNNLTTIDANFPILKASYAFASNSRIMENETQAITEMKGKTYNEVLNGTDYYTLSNGSYTLVDRNVAFDANETYYSTNIQKVYVQSFKAGETYYTYNSSTHTFSVANSYTANTQYYQGTFSTVSLSNYAKSTSSYDLSYLSYDAETVFKDSLLSNQYYNSEKDILEFVIFIKIEPDEEIVTSKMDELSQYTSELIEIEINNRLQFDLKLRSVPHKEGTIN